MLSQTLFQTVRINVIKDIIPREFLLINPRLCYQKIHSRKCFLINVIREFVPNDPYLC